MSLLLTRRAWLSFLLAAATSIGLAADHVPLDQNMVALFADLHITQMPQPAHQREGFSQRIQEVLALSPRPANVLFYGDVSFNKGDVSDYRQLKELVKPLEDAGIRWTACLGNHDRRAAFLSVFPDHEPALPLVPGRLVRLVETPHADFILLDSCLEGPVNGGLDDEQRAWLEKTLSGRSKPVFVGAHHPIAETGVAGLLTASAACKGYIFGHNHHWIQKRIEGVETLCLPSTGHWGDIGYVLVKLDPTGAVFTLCQHDYFTPRPAAKPEDAKPEWKQRTEKNNGCQWRVPFTQ